MSMLTVLKAEIRRTAQEARNYWLLTISNIFVTIIFFFGLRLSIPIENQGSGIFFLLSILLWYYSLEITNQMSHYILEEKYFGTIEKLFLSPYGPSAILAARAFSSILLSTSITTCLYLLLTFAAGASPLDITFPMVLVLFIALFGLYGFGFILAGLTVTNSRTSSVSYIVTYVMLFMSGMVAPLEAFPEIVVPVALCFPLTIPIKNLRIAATEHLSLVGFVTQPWLHLQIIYSISSVIIGLVIFRCATRRAKAKGTLRRV